MGLHWIVTECDTAEALNGTVYTVRQMSFGNRNRYVAVSSYMEGNKLWEFTIGVFDTRAAAKTACENDAKS